MMMKLFFGFIIFLASLSAKSEPIITTKFNFYGIHPKTSVDIKRELKKKTPIILDGKKFQGETTWYINWDFKWKKNNGVCLIYTVNTTLSVQYTLPKIPDDFPADPTIRNAFEKYYQALLNHELNHKNSGLSAAREIEKELLAISSYNCQKLEKIANNKGKSIIKKYNKHDKDYDRKTAHGRLEKVDIDLYI